MNPGKTLRHFVLLFELTSLSGLKIIKEDWIIEYCISLEPRDFVWRQIGGFRETCEPCKLYQLIALQKTQVKLVPLLLGL